MLGALLLKAVMDSRSCVSVSDTTAYPSSSTSYRSNSESSDSDAEPVSQLNKKRRLEGAAKYRTEFSDSWKKEFPFITSVAEIQWRV